MAEQPIDARKLTDTQLAQKRDDILARIDNYDPSATKKDIFKQFLGAAIGVGSGVGLYFWKKKSENPGKILKAMGSLPGAIFSAIAVGTAATLAFFGRDVVSITTKTMDELGPYNAELVHRTGMSISDDRLSEHITAQDIEKMRIAYETKMGAGDISNKVLEQKEPQPTPTMMPL